MRALLMRTCLADHVAPGVAEAAKRVLERQGVEVTVPRAQTCCGQPGWTAGHPDQARQVARQALRAFAGADPVVVPSGSCAAMVTHAYHELFAGQPEEAAARGMAGRTFELTQFLRQNDLAPGPAHDAPASVTYHDSCHMLRLLGERNSPREIIAGAGVELQEGRAGSEEVLCKGQGFELLVGRHHEFVGVALALSAFGVGDGFGEQAGAMEVHVVVQMLAAEGIDQRGEALRNMAVAEVFAHDGRVL